MNIDWDEIQMALDSAWREMEARGGSFADGPFEPGQALEESMEAIAGLEKLANDAIRDWIAKGVFPPMPPAANRYVATVLICGLGFARNLGGRYRVAPSCESNRQDALRWLLLELAADTTHTALDRMREDLLAAWPGE